MLKTVSVGTFVTRRVLSCGCVGMGGEGGLLMVVLRNLEWKLDLCLSVEIVFLNALVQCLMAVY